MGRREFTENYHKKYEDNSGSSGASPNNHSPLKRAPSSVLKEGHSASINFMEAHRHNGEDKSALSRFKGVNTGNSRLEL